VGQIENRLRKQNLPADPSVEPKPCDFFFLPGEGGQGAGEWGLTERMVVGRGVKGGLGRLIHKPKSWPRTKMLVHELTF